MEPILDPKNNRLTVYPIKYTDIWRAYKKQIAAFWTTEEIDFSKDLVDWAKLSKDEKYFWNIADSFRDHRVWSIEDNYWIKDTLWGKNEKYGKVFLNNDQRINFLKKNKC
jgi:hypothetical protein